MHVNISHLLPFLFLLPNLKIVILLFLLTTHKDYAVKSKFINPFEFEIKMLERKLGHDISVLDRECIKVGLISDNRLYCEILFENQIELNEFVQEFSNIAHLSAINMTAFYRSQGFAFIFEVMTE